MPPQSKLRQNYERVPRPEHVDVSQLTFKCPFPAEHPFSSHISRFAVFPKPDLDRPTSAPELPAPVIVDSKTRGSGERRERSLHSAETTTRWHEHSFNQLPKHAGAPRQFYYPTPPKLFAPNQDLDAARNASPRPPRSTRISDADMTESVRGRPEVTDGDVVYPPGYFIHTKDITETCHPKAFVGICPPDTECRPCSESPRFGEARKCYQCPPTSVVVEAIDPCSQRVATDSRPATEPPGVDEQLKCITTRPTLTEREEHRLLHGTTYANLPEDQPVMSLHPAYNYSPPRNINTYSGLNQCSGCPPVCQPLKPKHEDEYRRIIREQHDRHQQVEAQNRWRLLDSQTPAHDIGALRRKMALSSVKNGPEVFYDHEGRYQRERAGLYLTSYDPAKLAAVMNAEERSGGALGDLSTIERGSLDLPTTLNDEMAEAIRRGRTLGCSVAQYHDMPSPYELFRPFDIAKTLQKRHIQPSPPSADIRTQEGDIVWTHLSTYQGDYNTQRYLQENFPVAMHARQEPLQVMSSVNQDLSRVRASCRKPVVVKVNPPETVCCDIHATSTGMRRSLAASLYNINYTTPSPPNPCPPGPPSGSYEYRLDPDSYDLSVRLKPRLAKRQADCSTDIVDRGIGCVRSRAETLVKFNESRCGQGPPDLRKNIVGGKKHHFAADVHSQVLRGSTIIAS